MPEWVKLINYPEIRKLLDEEYKRKMLLVRAGETHLDNMAEGFMGAEKVIFQLPNVDAVEVVRCVECIYSNSCEIEGMLFGDGIENPYCAGGERREENAEP